MSEQMVEITEVPVLQEAADLYPNLRKVTLDAAHNVAYVFTGRSNQAKTVRGAEYEALAAMLLGSLKEEDPEEEDPEKDAAGAKGSKRGKNAEGNEETDAK
jgi:hypothetical protein